MTWVLKGLMSHSACLEEITLMEDELDPIFNVFSIDCA